MDTILQIVPALGYAAVFDRVNDRETKNRRDERGRVVPGKVVVDILAETDAHLLTLPLLFFALVRRSLPRSGVEETRVVGVYLDPEYGYLELCERADGKIVYAGRLLGYLPPDSESHFHLIDNFRWITASRIDGRFVEEEAWKQAVARREQAQG